MMYRTLHRRSSTSANETEALQTDVMRFLVIICLCLMIVFALVQAIPVSDSSNAPKITNAELLHKDLELLQAQIVKLQLARTALETRLLEARTELQSNSSTIEEQKQILRSLDHEQKEKLAEIRNRESALELLIDQVNKAKEKEEKLLETVKKASLELSAKRADLAKVTQLVEQGRRQLNIVQAEIMEVQRNLQDLSLSSKQQPAPAPKEQVSQGTIRPQPAETQKGFSLLFVSDEALLRLLQTDSGVALFMLSGKESYKLEARPDGTLLFHPAGAPDKMYEMAKHTVPAGILTAARKTIAAFGAGSVTYGVYLPASITGQFKELIDGRDGGQLVISAHGLVTIK